MSESFSKKLEDLMLEKGISTYDLADAINISHTSISRYINGKMLPRPKTLNKIAEYFHISPSYLMEIKEDRPHVKLIKTLIKETSELNLVWEISNDYFDFETTNRSADYKTKNKAGTLFLFSFSNDTGFDSYHFQVKKEDIVIINFYTSMEYLPNYPVEDDLETIQALKTLEQTIRNPSVTNEAKLVNELLKEFV